VKLLTDIQSKRQTNR